MLKTTGKYLILMILLAALALAQPKFLDMLATAYAIDGIQKSGTVAQEGTAAADPTVLPLGSRVRVHAPDQYIGEFVITDTGSAIKGNRLDIFYDDPAQAKKFGRRKVRVEILELGKGPESAKREVLEGLTPPAKQ